VALATVGILGLSACGGGGGAASSGDVQDVKLAHCCAPDSHWNEAAEKFASLVKSKTDGDVAVKVFPGAQLGAEKEVVENVQSGTLEMTFVSSDPLGGFAPEVQVLSQPYIFDSPEHAFKVLDGPIGKQLEEALLKKGLLVLGWGDNGQRVYTNSKRPIQTPADLDGLKIRSPQSPVNLAITEKFGGAGVAMAYGETYTALQQGTIDGQENAVINIYPAKLQEVQKYMSMTKHLMSFALIIVNPKWFDKQTSETQEALRAAAKEAMDFQRKFSQDQSKEFTEKLAQSGMKISEPDLGPFRAATADMHKEFVGKAFSQELYDSIRAAK
jgi:tripartite ATP-independent transporter DctP family solute receptor